jgi:protein-arginine kinase activator protein McsA
VGEVYLPPEAVGRASPRSELEELRDQLRRAVEAENFELAAELRDRIRVLDGH